MPKITYQFPSGINGLNGLLTEGLAVLHYTQCCTSRSFMSSVKRGNVDPDMLASWRAYQASWRAYQVNHALQRTEPLQSKLCDENTILISMLKVKKTCKDKKKNRFLRKFQRVRMRWGVWACRWQIVLESGKREDTRRYWNKYETDLNICEPAYERQWHGRSKKSKTK